MGSEHLFTIPGSEDAFDDPAAAYEADIEPWADEHDRRPREIEEYTSFTAAKALPAADDVVTWVSETFAKRGRRVVAWFSRGAASAVATKLTLLDHPDAIVACIALTTEHEDSVRFAADCERWFDRQILYLHSDRYADTWAVWEGEKFLVGPHGSPCTGILKRQVRHAFAQPDDINVFGFTADEPHRLDRIRESEPGVSITSPLIDRGITKDDCFEIVEAADIALPAMYELGYDNNNCIGCVKGGMGYWNAIRVDFPEVFDRMALVERERNHAINSDDDGPVWLDELNPKRGDFRRDQPRSCSLLCQPTLDLLVPTGEERTDG